MPAEDSSPILTADWGHSRSGLGATEGSPCRGGLGSLWSPIQGMSGGSGRRGSAAMAGSEQHQSLSLKQLKVPCCSFCLAPTARGRRFWGPCVGLSCLVRAEAWAPCDPTGSLHICPVHSHCPKQPPTSPATPDPGWGGGGGGGMVWGFRAA